MKKCCSPSLKHENGFALVISLIMLVVLSLLGMHAITNTTNELNIAAIERRGFQAFDAADSGWQQVVPFLNRKASAPESVNINNYDSQGSTVRDIVRNYGNGGDGTWNNVFPNDAPDGIFTNMMNLQYWYRVIYINSDSPAPGCGSNFRTFVYGADCSAGFSGGTNEVATTVTRVFKAGY